MWRPCRSISFLCHAVVQASSRYAHNKNHILHISRLRYTTDRFCNQSRDRDMATSSPRVVAGRRSGLWIPLKKEFIDPTHAKDVDDCALSQRQNHGVWILSQNLLADIYVEKCRLGWMKDPVTGAWLYEHVPAADMAWDTRLQRLISEFKELLPDVLCLQEVEFDVFDKDLVPALEACGYNGIMQADPNRMAKQSTGNATFYNAAVLTPTWTRHGTRTLMTAYTVKSVVHPDNSVAVDDDGKPLTGELLVANVHLQGDPKKLDQRIAQLKSCVKHGVRRERDVLALDARQPWGMVVCGDFNEDVSKAGMMKDAMNECDLANPDAMTAAGLTDPTFPMPLGTYRLDFFLHHASKVWVSDVANFLSDEGERTQALTNKIPSAVFPSDHLPVAACVCVRPPTTKRKHIVDATPSYESAEAMWHDAPMTEEQKAAYALLMDEETRVRPKGKPTAEQISALQNTAQKKRDFLAELPADTVQFLKRYKQMAQASGRKSKKKTK
eukprot:m.1266745 g.1266745  ORF g.1266745 m.1266745 type:complete len:497 (-) comp24741_c0_seq36:2099-3589(-)